MKKKIKKIKIIKKKKKKKKKKQLINKMTDINKLQSKENSLFKSALVNIYFNNA